MLMLLLAIEDEDDRVLIEQMYIRYEKHLYLLALRILDNHHDAQDCVQDTFASAVRYIHLYRERTEKSRVYLLRVTCRNIAIDKYRAKVKRAEDPISSTDDTEGLMIPDPDEDLFAALVNTLTHEMLVALIRALEPKYREVILLRYYEDMTTAEIAAQLGVTARTVRNRLEKAYEILRNTGGEMLHEFYYHN